MSMVQVFCFFVGGSAMVVFTAKRSLAVTSLFTSSISFFSPENMKERGTSRPPCGKSVENRLALAIWHNHEPTLPQEKIANSRYLSRYVPHNLCFVYHRYCVWVHVSMMLPNSCWHDSISPCSGDKTALYTWCPGTHESKEKFSISMIFKQPSSEPCVYSWFTGICSFATHPTQVTNVCTQICVVVRAFTMGVAI